MKYQTKTIAALLDVSRNTLLAWERRYQLVVPARTQNGYRIYSEEDLVTLQSLKTLLNHGHPIGQAVRIIQSQTAPRETTSTHALSDIRIELKHALLQFDRSAADRILNQLTALSFKVLIKEVFFPILYTVGDGWIDGTISIVQEHFISSFVRDHMVSIFLRLGSGASTGPSVVCACYPDEEHELGLLGVSIQMAQTGWKVTHLGTKVPVSELIDFVSEHTPRLLCISLMTHRSQSELLAYINQLRSKIPDETVIVFGGLGTRSFDLDMPDVHVIGNYDHLVEISREVA
jgi:DNA-binding transcriptional MerR regulator